MSERDDDLEWEEWLTLSDAQQEAVCDREMLKYQRRLDMMTVRQQINYHRGSALESCLRWRRSMKAFNMDFMREHLRQSQIGLLKLRIWRATGVYPGES